MQDFTVHQHSFQSYSLISAHKHLQTAAEDIVQLRRSFDAVQNEASTIASTWDLPRQFLNKRVKKTKVYFNEVSEGITLSNPKKRFCVIVFIFDDGHTFLPTN